MHELGWIGSHRDVQAAARKAAYWKTADAVLVIVFVTTVLGGMWVWGFVVGANTADKIESWASQVTAQ